MFLVESSKLSLRSVDKPPYLPELVLKDILKTTSSEGFGHERILTIDNTPLQLGVRSSENAIF